jgi:hypothetical protein
MSKHDPEVALRQILLYAQEAVNISSTRKYRLHLTPRPPGGAFSFQGEGTGRHAFSPIPAPASQREGGEFYIPPIGCEGGRQRAVGQRRGEAAKRLGGLRSQRHHRTRVSKYLSRDQTKRKTRQRAATTAQYTANR